MAVFAAIPSNMLAHSSSPTLFSSLNQADQLNLLTVAFEGCFVEMNTLLMRAEEFHGAEPIYLPAAQGGPAKIGYAHGFVRSLLHETAHWTIAGAARRAQIDYGYWYAPDGRSSAEQREFEAAEVKPQAIEWLCCEALGIGFEPSLDNLHLISSDELDRPAYDGGVGFRHALEVKHQRFGSGEDRLPPRAQRWIACLRKLGAARDSTELKLL